MALIRYYPLFLYTSPLSIFSLQHNNHTRKKKDF